MTLKIIYMSRLFDAYQDTPQYEHDLIESGYRQRQVEEEWWRYDEEINGLTESQKQTFRLEDGTVVE